MYSPGASAPFEELVRLCKVVAKQGRVYATHIGTTQTISGRAVEEQLDSRGGPAAGCRSPICRPWVAQLGAASAGCSTNSEQAAASGLDVV